MSLLENLYTDLQALIEKDQLGALQGYHYNALIDEHELLQASYALVAQRHWGRSQQPLFHSLPSGAIPLFEKGCFPWGPFPYPEQHAQLGTLLAQLDHQEIRNLALAMIPFQEATLDHNQQPLLSFFSQQASRQALEKANHHFFKALNHTPSKEGLFLDHTLGIISHKTTTSTVACMASGCKSGMGLFLDHNEGLINFGPQLLPTGDCAGFGLAGRGKNIQLSADANQFSLSYHCRLAAPSARQTDFTYLKDSGFSGFWLDASLYGDHTGLTIEGTIEGIHPIDQLLFSFFGKAHTCSVAKIHKLTPRSLDRYQGPAQPLTFGNIEILPHAGLSQLEVIPLAGDASYWEADFLATFTLHSPHFIFHIKKI